MSKAKILVVEDESIVAKDIQSTLIHLGYNVPATTRSGADALEMTAAIRPNLVLMDIRLPGDIDGIEAAATLRERFRTPVVYLTAYADEKTLARAKVTEPFGYIVKPFEERNLYTAIEMALYKRDMERRLEELLAREEQARIEAQKANQAKDLFLANLSHELRTPLTTVIAWAQILRRGDLGRTTVQHVSEVIERSAKAQAQINDDLLDSSRIMMGKLSIDIQEVALAPALARAVESVRPSAQQKSIAIVLECDLSPRQVAADPIRLQQVLWNLLSNAIKFTPEGGVVSLIARTSSLPTDEGTPAVLIEVSDTGEGIPAEFLHRLFDRFAQVDTSLTCRHGGLGLGLAIVKDLIDLQGGVIHVESPGVGLGSTFRVWLPATAKVDHARPHASP